MSMYPWQLQLTCRLAPCELISWHRQWIKKIAYFSKTESPMLCKSELNCLLVLASSTPVLIELQLNFIFRSRFKESSFSWYCGTCLLFEEMEAGESSLNLRFKGKYSGLVDTTYPPLPLPHFLNLCLEIMKENKHRVCLCCSELSRLVSLNQSAAAPWSALKYFQGCCRLLCNVNPVRCANMNYKINTEISNGTP